VNPFFFGTSARQLFGAYEPPATAARGGVVLCQPLGDEYLFAYPTVRLLSAMLAKAGYHVLRFDYYGTGDSAGDFEDTVQADWIADIGTAVTELKDVAQLQQVGLLGLRYGASLAALVARTRDDIDQLVLWDAVFNASGFFQEVTAQLASPDADLEAGGIVLTARMRRDIAAVTIDSFSPPLPRTLIAVTTPTAEDHQAVQARLSAAGVEATLVHAPQVAAWRNAHITAAGMPVDMLRSIVGWMS
jgi:alpha/beta superfamily hydrolase